MKRAPQSLLEVHVVPGAKRTEAAGWHDGVLRVRVAAPPVEGAANEALLRWVADQLGVARRDCELCRGASSRRKQVLLHGVDPARLAAWLSAHRP